ncbi:GNAT family N-acetyltransferase [Streptomyces sp. NPDC006544]|uniref:GNAT family N-acetyltransferase n=1 Tax=Streptomyces sp. NPDC006544 TaxID=3154583 RepID=UPI0033B3FBB4
MTPELRVAATAATAGLVLRPWGAGDAEALVEVHRDPAMRHWLTRTVDGPEGARRWLEEQREGWESGNRLSFAVREASYPGARGGACGGPPVAGVVLKRTAERPGSAEAGYWTAAPARGRGVATRALEAVAAWAFAAFPAEAPGRLDRLELLHQVDNLASCRVADKAGFRFDRILPAFPPSFPMDGHLHVRRPPGGASASETGPR